MNQFKLKIAGTISSIIVVIIALLTGLNYGTFKDESVELNKQILREKNATVEAMLTEKFDSYRQFLASINISSRDILDDTLSQEARSQLQTLYRAQREIIEEAYIFTAEGNIYNSKGKKLGVNVKDLKRTYHSSLFNDGKNFFVSIPFKSVVSGKQALGISYKLDNAHASLIVVYLDKILESVAERKDMFMYDEEGSILVSPYTELLGQNIFQERPLYKEFNRSSPELSYTAEVKGEETDFTAFWGQLDVTGWNYVTFVRENTIKQSANSQLTSSVIIGSVSLIVAIFVLLITINRLVLIPVGGAPDEIASLMYRMANGELNQSLVITGNETGIYQSLVNFSKQLYELIKNSHGISESVSSSAQELNVIMNDLRSNSQNELAQVEQISTAINELSSTSQEVSDKAVMAEEEARKARENVNNGKSTLERNISLTSNINDSVADSASIVNELRQYAVEIGSVTEVINGISEQTNLLALNAAIEAARAGEHGRGFAVVADEVRALASKTQSSTVSIQEIIEKLQAQSEKANENMTKNIALINESVELADHVKASFEDISTSVESISEINTLVATASHQQHSVTEDISRNTTEAFDLVQQNVSSVTETLQASSDLSKMAETQKSELSYFRV